MQVSLLFGLAWAQYNYHYDLRNFNLGFNMAANYSQLKIEYGNLSYSDTMPTPKSVLVRGIPGIQLGLISNLKLHKYFDLRFIPNVSLQQRNLNFYLRDTVLQRKIEASYLNLPLLVKYKSQFYKGYRVYVVGGIMQSFNLVSDKRVRDNPNLIRIEKQDFSWVAGVGIDLYGDKVKLSPELTYSLGFRNVYDPTGTRFGYVIKSLKMQTLTLNLHFE
ncbi:MAG: type IX secretion/gliding motility protein PorT/SprT [Bacteroidia bacterium]